MTTGSEKKTKTKHFQSQTFKHTCSVFSQCYVIRGMWKSALSNRSGLLAGEGSLSALCRSLNSPVPIFIGIPIMMHSDTPETGTQEMLRPYQRKVYSYYRAEAHHRRSPFVQSRRRRRDDQLFSRRRPASGRSLSFLPSQTW